MSDSSQNPIFDAREVAQALEKVFPSAQIAWEENLSPSAQHAIVLGPAHALACAQWLKKDSPWQWDFLSNVTGVDWTDEALALQAKARIKSDPSVDPESLPKEGYLEAVYHLYSINKGLGPLVLRLRTANRKNDVSLPSLTPVWRSAEFQEREIFDLFGIVFDGHPDMRRIMMWDDFEGHPMRKDFVEADDYEYEPTPHDAVLKRCQEHFADPANGRS